MKQTEAIPMKKEHNQTGAVPDPLLIQLEKILLP